MRAGSWPPSTRTALRAGTPTSRASGSWRRRPSRTPGACSPPRWPTPTRCSIFEHGGLYNASGELPADAGPVDIDSAAIRRPGSDVSLITYGGTLATALDAAAALAQDGVDAEVIDLRTLRPLDDATILASVRRTHRAVVIDEGWRSGSLSAEISARITEQAFYDLDAPVGRVCSAEVPMPYARHLELAALPTADGIVAAVQRAMRGEV